MENFINIQTPEYIFFLQHTENKDRYLIIQDSEKSMMKKLEQFNRSGEYEGKTMLTLPHINLNIAEKILKPDDNLFGLYYFLCNEVDEITYEEDSRYPFAEWGWYVIKDSLQTNKWLHEYISTNEARKAKQKEQQTEIKQISLF